eukprot:TRINITY_DN2570_c0_g2_i8.p1 TRINITY_DN2570_c0_g2~~TRINITY_DN2570_c0_g2_i8.p1  ORF type:complete len:118 (+),score=6.14 TRINITY_DN2570_c0_g2_i8:3-356(+)
MVSLLFGFYLMWMMVYLHIFCWFQLVLKVIINIFVMMIVFYVIYLFIKSVFIFFIDIFSFHLLYGFYWMWMIVSSVWLLFDVDDGISPYFLLASVGFEGNYQYFCDDDCFLCNLFIH